ncbi:hypothetical protein B0H10DRAFT_769361 [Mycena sp. CBHHK59/15]|nr:hypothetical protein B0H10DRAFT_769361 [Mycena sp. CBHHK59/15]
MESSSSGQTFSSIAGGITEIPGSAQPGSDPSVSASAPVDPVAENPSTSDGGEVSPPAKRPVGRPKEAKTRPRISHLTSTPRETSSGTT